MSYFRPSGVNETPYIQIVRWKIYRVKSELWPEQTYHLNGYNLTEGHGRASSAIVNGYKTVDEKLIVETESGRQYELVGDSCYDPDGSYVWGIYCSRNQIIEFFDASKEFWEKDE